MRHLYLLPILFLSPLLAGDREERTWTELPALTGSDVRFAMPNGAVFSGTLTAVEPGGLVVQIKKTTDKANFPKGRFLVPRAEVKVFDVRSKSSRYRVIGTVSGAALGFGLGVLAAVHTDSTAGAIGAFAGVTGGTATLGYFLGDAADHRTTTIVVRQ
jgi:hypothetical protein